MGDTDDILFTATTTHLVQISRLLDSITTVGKSATVLIHNDGLTFSVQDSHVVRGTHYPNK